MSCSWYIHFNKWPLYLIYGLQKFSSLDLHELLLGPFISTNGLFTLSTASRSSPASTYMSLSWSIHFNKWPLYLIYSLQKFSGLDLHELILVHSFQQMASLPYLQPPEVLKPRLTWAASWSIHFTKWPLYLIFSLQRFSSLDLHGLLLVPFIFNKWPLYLIYSLQKFSGPLGLQETLLGPFISTNGLFTLSTASRSIRPRPLVDTSWSQHPYKWPLYLIYSLEKFSGLGHQETLLVRESLQMASLPYLQPPEVLQPRPPGDTPWSEHPHRWPQPQRPSVHSPRPGSHC